MSALSQYPILTQVFEATIQRSRQEPESVRTNQAGWHQELTDATGDAAAIGEIVRKLLEESKDSAAGFWDCLERLVFLGSFGEPVEDFAGLLTERAIASLSTEHRQALLKQLTDRKASFFFSGGRWLLPGVLAQNFSEEFVADWFVARLNAYGEDGASVDLWRLVQELAEKQPAYALTLARVPAFASIDGRKFQIELLGTLRFRPYLPPLLLAELAITLEPMRTSAEATERANYWRTMKRPLALGRLPDDDLEKALAATTRSPEEYEVGFELARAGSRPPAPKAQTLRLLHWLATQLDQPRTPGQQYAVASVVWLAVEHVSFDDLGFDIADLLVRLQPVDAAYRGIWQQIESALFSLSRKSMVRFRRVLRLLSKDQSAVLVKMLEPNAPLHGVLSRLSEKQEETATFAADLIASKVPGERRLGFYLTENLQLPAAKEPGTKFTPEEFSIWLAEFRINIVYRTMASQLMSAATRIDLSHPEMVHAFQEEVLFQCKNLPGLCLSQIKEKRTQFSLLEKPITEAEAYFTALQDLAASPIKAMHIPGLGPAIRRKRAKDQVKMEAEVAAHSIFEQFVKKSYLLYGTTWATFNGGVLGKETSLESHSVSAEYPRKLFIDPEGAMLMNFGAQSDLRKLKPTEEEAPA